MGSSRQRGQEQGGIALRENGMCVHICVQNVMAYLGSCELFGVF